MAAVPADRRYVRGRRCPICDGADGDQRGSERRCFGFLSEDGQFAHCSREERAGSVKLSEGSQTYGHRRYGPCACGTQHAAAETKPAQQRRIVAEYDYRDEGGTLVYQVVRFEPKGFRQRRPDPEHPDRWLWNLEGVRRVLYHLDRVLEAPLEQTIYVVEGEKDVEALEALGLVATCNPQGAGKWATVAECAARALAGRRVVVIPDGDDKGRKHAAEVATALAPIATVRVLELPGAKDAADWIRDGGTAEQLEQLVNKPASEPTIEAIDPSKDFDRNEDGKVYHSQRNIKLAIAKLGVRIRYNTFARRRIVEGLPGFGPRLDDDALNHLRLLIDAKFHFRLSKDFWYDVIVDHGHEYRYHPVVDYLAGLTWDGMPRLDGWLTRYGGAEDTPYTRAIGSLVLIAAVRRVRSPGCKFDEMLILESKQGKNKSSALAVLAVQDDWFTDDLPLGEETRKMIEQTTGRWIVEAGELRGIGRSDVHTLRQYLGRTKDTARLAYGREPPEIPRSFVIIGTMNPNPGGYLRDDGTGNRRFWPVYTPGFDLDLLRAERDQLWAEAAAREAAGASIRLDPKLYEAAKDAQDERRTEDPYDVIVRESFGELTGRISIRESWKVLNLNRPPTQDEMQRFGVAMRLHGWHRSRGRHCGDITYVYSKGEDKRWLNVSSGVVG